MEIVFCFLVFTAVSCFAGAAGIIMYRQAKIRALGGGRETSVFHKAADFGAYIKKAVLGFNKRFAGYKRYRDAAVILRKLDYDAGISAEDVILAEQACVILSFTLFFMFTGSPAFSAAAGITCFFVPVFILKAKARKKEEEILAELPDALDIIGASIEGGLSLNISMQRYTEKNKNMFSGELGIAVNNIRLGKTFDDSLKEMSDKLRVREVEGFVNGFIRAEKLGGNVKQFIRTGAEDMRKKRFQELRKKAHEAPVKLLIPLMIFIFPVIFIVLFGPVVIKLMAGGF